MIQKEHIDHGAAFDFGQTSQDYAKYRDIYPPLFYQKILSLGLCTKGQRVLDLGTGTGVLPRNLYAQGASFVGADLSENQIAQARRLSTGMDIAYQVASAETVAAPDGAFDAVTACQCFAYFDRAVVLPKIHRMLKDGGHFCILFMAWLPRESEIASATEAMVLRYNPGWTGCDMQRTLPEIPAESQGLFEVETRTGFDLSVTFTRDTWHGRIMTCRGVGASSLSRDQIDAFDREHRAYLQTVPEPFEIPHYATILNLRKC